MNDKILVLSKSDENMSLAERFLEQYSPSPFFSSLHENKKWSLSLVQRVSVTFQNFPRPPLK